MSAMRPYDIAVIGSGPAAVAALDKLSGIEHVAVITGATSSRISNASLHPKIQAVATKRHEHGGVAEPIIHASSRSKPLFSTAITGGLANYWGQQFVAAAAEDPWPRESFRDHFDYLSECNVVERLFAVDGGDVLDTALTRSGYCVRVPRLLVGSSDDRGSDLHAMRCVFHAINDKLGAQLLDARAICFAPHGEDWTINLDDGRAIIANRVILAGGVIGDAQLLLRSFPDLTGALFSDHSPWMFYVVGLKGLLAERRNSARNHFNAITIEKIERGKCTAFASVYDMSLADLNLLLALVVGRSISLLNGLPAPPGASLVTPVQIWTPETFDIIEIERSDRAFTAHSGPKGRPESESALDQMITFIGTAGGRVLRKSRTQPGFGFHYHDLRFKSDDGKLENITEFLKDRTGGGVTCVDAAALPSIGCRPHTLTAMANARRLTAQLIATKFT